ncbi:uncharacterized protein KY384_005217 [Bacidia gigantensis]|uniref:uncharacterized protein n=1 Tax=Bacidia gigantensis TaxID=2732470 RepID=UPI001D048108|nr:uncharacterized protein KY384_005217 [Bacidia gigantensis]KAG8529736.1 hypothetical protein KY384_005217 [Bacidia gigantensis]
MPVEPQKPYATGSKGFDPDDFLAQWPKKAQALSKHDFRSSIIDNFNLPHNDSYVYHAIASVTLSQVQEATNHGREANLHACSDDLTSAALARAPPQADTEAYTTLFSPTTTPQKALKAFASNARKYSLRASSATYLHSQRLLPSHITIPRSKAHINPAYDVWALTCKTLEWCGPTPSTHRVRSAHHILPVMMHHFGCVVPSYEALEIIKQLSSGRTVLDVGSGNGYWTYMLRRHGVETVAVDNKQSEWRVMWIGDTISTDGVEFLRKRDGGKGEVLLLVYPVVGGEFTERMVRAYEGDMVVVAATQNRSGYTAFKDRRVDEWMVEKVGGWEKVVQVALPSFAGKDEGLFVFERRKGRQSVHEANDLDN